MTKREKARVRLGLLAGALVGVLALVACGSDTGSEELEAAVAGSTPSASSVDSTNSTSSASAHGHPGIPAPEVALRNGERFLEIGMEEAYAPKAVNGGTDDYRCFLVDPGLAKPEFLIGAQFAPSNKDIVHHANVYLVDPANVAAARQKDADDEGQGWQCFGTDGVRGQAGESAWVDTWTPNGKESLLTQDVGFQMQPGSLLVLQVHYNLLATGGKEGAEDRSGIRLRLSDGTSETKPLYNVPLMAPIELPCTKEESGPLCDREASLKDVSERFGAELAAIEPGLVAQCAGGEVKPGNTQSCDTQVPMEMTVYAGRGHMHLLGAALKVELNPGTPKAQTLLDVPVFDFDNQQRVALPEPVKVGPGDTVRVTCTHDASLRSKLPQLKMLPPRYVVYGDGSSDEMCIGLMSVTIP
ncbi:hypothetical protein LWF15_18520 [Kineosporia rhizophila]|uniref:monooxygenase n=1 Tax=Kineosporia rhizophila TaxID=84633 RepID=UPI001E53BA1D|nr:hypothetical protein [Kineosporia rhizophila]MCE0537494.1 hypothetical protein [Kineosporia rhizophila]